MYVATHVVARYLVGALLALAPALAFATCNAVVNVPSALMASDAITWSACGTSGTGIQSALDTVAAAGGGSVKLLGAGSVLVRAPLDVKNRTMLFGDNGSGGYMRLVGENANSSCALGGTSRQCPVVRVSGQTSTPAAGATYNVVIWNLDFDGTTSGRPLSAAAVQIVNSNKVNLVTNRIRGARTFGVQVWYSTATDIQYLSLDLVRKTGSEPEGGCGIHIFQGTDTTVEYSIVTGSDWYNAGLPNIDPRAGVNAPPTMDTIASYGATRTRIQHNTLTYGHSAGVYLARCESLGCTPMNTNDVSSTIWDNDITYFRQTAMDVAHSNSPTVVTNRANFIGDVPFVCADCQNGTFQYNILQGGGMNPSYFTPRGTMHFLWGSSNNSVSGNYFYGAGVDYAVYLRPASDGFGNPAGNVITGNSLWSGSAGYIGGYTTGNTVTPNTLY